MPPAYNAWLIFRNCVDVILANDVVAFLVFALMHFEPIDSSLDVLSIAVGVILGYAFYKSKLEDIKEGGCVAQSRYVHLTLHFLHSFSAISQFCIFMGENGCAPCCWRLCVVLG